VALWFEDWSRLLGFIALGALSYAQMFIGVTVHDVAWWCAGLLLAGEHMVELSDKLADKIIKALNIRNK